MTSIHIHILEKKSMENTPHYDQHCEWVHSILKFYSENEFVFEIKTASIEVVILRVCFSLWKIRIAMT